MSVELVQLLLFPLLQSVFSIWKDEKMTVSNRELKSMVEFYKKDLVPKYDIPEL